MTVADPVATAGGQPVVVGSGTPLGGPQYCLETNASLNLAGDDLRNYLPIHGVLFRFDMRIVQPLFTFGKLDAARDLAQAGLDIARAQADGSRADLALNMVRAYFGVKTARAVLDTIRDGKEQLDKWVQIGKAAKIRLD